MTENIPISRIAECNLPTKWGNFTMIGYTENATAKEHIALVMGDIESAEPILARIHSECLTGDALFSRRCDCGPQLEAAMQQIQKVGCGVIVYLRQEGRGIGLINKIKAYKLQENGMDTVEANIALGLPVDQRNFTLAKNILTDLKIKNIRLMTNNPEKIKVLKETGINIVERIPLQVGIQADNHDYIETKKHKLGHLFTADID